MSIMKSPIIATFKEYISFRNEHACGQAKQRTCYPKTLSSMAEKGPCSHCGVQYTPLWRTGPNGEPTLCNACGLRWKTRGDLDNYTPKHTTSKANAIKSNPLRKLHTLRYSDRSGGDSSSGGSTASFLNKKIECDGKTGKEDSGLVSSRFSDPEIPRRKRTKLDQYVPTTVEVLHKELLHILNQPEFAKLREEEEELLITPHNNQIPPGEIGLGCMLLKSPSSDSKSN